MRPTLAGALLALAVGVRVPRYLAAWLCEARWPRFSRRRYPDKAAMATWSDLDVADVPYYWMIVAVLALIVGLMTLTLPRVMDVLAGALGYCQAHFLWSPIPYSILGIALGFVAAAAALVPVAMLLVCLHHLYQAPDHWDLRALNWFVAGMAPAAAGFRWLTTVVPLSEAAPTLAALPLFMITVIAVMASRSRPTTSPAEVSRGPVPQAPLLQDRRPTVVRAAIVLACVCAVALADGAGGDWGDHPAAAKLAVTATLSGGYERYPWTAIMLLAAGAGAAIGIRATHRRCPSISGFGAACAVAVGWVSLAAMGWSGRAAWEWHWMGTAGAIAALAFAAAYGTAALGVRVGSRAALGSTLLWRMIAAAASWLAFSGALGHLGVRPVAVTVVAAVLVLLSAVLILREPTHHFARRRFRLALAAAALGLLALS